MPTYYAPGKRKGNQTFIVRGSINGRQYEIATDATNKRTAEAEWQKFATDTRRDERDSNRDRETATFEWACDEYLAVNPDAAPQWKRNIGALRSHFAGWYLKNMTPEDFHAAAHKLGAGLKPQSKNTKFLGPAAAVMHYMARRKLCDHMIVTLLDPKDVRRPIMYPEDLQPFIDAAEGQLKAFLMTLQIHGWRVSEVFGIRVEKIDWKRAQIERWVSKSQEWRWAAVDHQVLAAWRDLPKRADGYLFEYRDRVQVYRAIDKLAASMGLALRYRPHQSRRGLATTLRDLGFSVDDIRDAGQWENSASVKPYIRDNPERVRVAFEKLRGSIGGRKRSA